MRKTIDQAAERILKQAHVTTCVDRMLEVSGQRISFEGSGSSSVEDAMKKLIFSHPDYDGFTDLPSSTRIVYYRSPVENAPLVIGFHSGGFLFGGAALNDAMWSSMSQKMGVNIASVSYRKSPKFKWRHSLADAACAVINLFDHAGELGFDKEHISLFGCSAGGTLAASVCELLYSCSADESSVDHISVSFDHLILLYPLLDMLTEPAEKGPEWYGGPAAYMMNEHHVDITEAGLPLVSPVFAEDELLSSFPHTICITAENDVLRHEGRRFAERISHLTGNAEHREAKGMPHCFFELGFGRDRLTEFEYDFIGEAGVRAFENGSINTSANDTLDYLAKFFTNQ